MWVSGAWGLCVRGVYAAAARRRDFRPTRHPGEGIRAEVAVRMPKRPNPPTRGDEWDEKSPSSPVIGRVGRYLAAARIAAALPWRSYMVIVVPPDVKVTLRPTFSAAAIAVVLP